MVSVRLVTRVHRKSETKFVHQLSNLFPFGLRLSERASDDPLKLIAHPISLLKEKYVFPDKTDHTIKFKALCGHVTPGIRPERKVRSPPSGH